MSAISPEPDVVGVLRLAGCVFAEDEARLLVAAADDPAELAGLVERRVEGEPLEQILGWVEFCGLRITVAPGVFVPRRRTEQLVRQAAVLARELPSMPVVVDLCCGCGALGVALASTIGAVELYAADVDPRSVRCARGNVEPLGGVVLEGDLFAALPPELRGRVDLLLVNAPYVPTGSIETMPPEARLHEPRTALDGGADGLDVLRRMITDAPSWLSARGSLLFEAGTKQADQIATDVVASGLVPQVLTLDDATVVLASRSAPDGSRR